MFKKRLFVNLLILAVISAVILSACTPAPVVTGIEGRVYFSDTNEPISDVNLMLNDPQLSKQDTDLTIAKTTTNSNGDFSFKNIIPGTYKLTLYYVTKTRVKSVLGTPIGSHAAFSGQSKDGKTYLYILEPEIIVTLGEVVQQDFVIEK